MRALFVLPLAALLWTAGTGRAADAGDEASRSYRIVTDGSTVDLKAGQAGRLVLVVEPSVAKVHVNAQAPFQIRLEASPGLKLEKDHLAYADGVGEPARRFEVPFTAASAGKQMAKAQLDFFICSDAWCVKQTKTVTIAVDVK